MTLEPSRGLFYMHQLFCFRSCYFCSLVCGMSTQYIVCLVYRTAEVGNICSEDSLAICHTLLTINDKKETLPYPTASKYLTEWYRNVIYYMCWNRNMFIIIETVSKGPQTAQKHFHWKHKTKTIASIHYAFYWEHETPSKEISPPSPPKKKRKHTQIRLSSERTSGP